ncbi:DEAD/DEAH box helicase [Clostridium sardiniense]|uniref:SNF2-related protein n=1 Tax=Clostridium sardiniense TaxID=29369 RepID=UPI00195E091E|nr:DEAD/DEAH box helicase [Clostridium sardiniense]MBM7836462.1 SNF2 family DNA or RNA helicase [Clostridium sardiniense]
MEEINLFPHQVQALKDTESFKNVAYYLDMGLGKTFVGSEKLKIYDNKINLLICQKSKIDDWKEHFQKYYDYNIVIYDKKKEISNNSVIIINYDLVWRRPELLELKDFTLMLDESSCIKNSTSKRTKFILKLKPSNVILLSGTPVGGKYEELHSQLKLLGWKISKKAFWSNYIKTHLINVGGFKMPTVIGYKNIDRLKRKLRDHGSIFMKTEEVINLPEQMDNVIEIKNTSMYKKFLKDRLITIDLYGSCEFKDDSDFYGEDVTPRAELVGDTSLTYMLYQRQLASQYNNNKFSTLRDLMESTEDRILIFYNFNDEMKGIKELCKKLKKPVSIVNGEIKDLKNYESKNNSVTLIQYQAGAMGLNLQKANKIIYFGLTLSSELFEQSKKRIHRLGQNKTCFYYYLITKDSIEEKIYKTLLERKDFTNKLFEEI